VAIVCWTAPGAAHRESLADVDRAKRFDSEQVGFVVDHDTQATDELRNVQLTPPGSAQGLQVVVPDIEPPGLNWSGGASRSAGSSTSTTAPGWTGEAGRWNSFVFFSDPDGNGWILQERPAPST
jgi:hypothetical protein